jgi:phasin family protein
MTDADTSPLTQGFQSALFEPMRHYFTALTNFTETLAHLQSEALNNYAAMSAHQIRSLLDVQDADAFSDYVAQQQATAKNLGEQASTQARRAAEASQTLLQETQQVAQEGFQSASQAMRTEVIPAKGRGKAATKR